VSLGAARSLLDAGGSSKEEPILRTVACALLALFVPAACGGSPPPPPEASSTAADATSAAGVDVPLLAKSGSQLSGSATFSPVPGGVRVTVRVAGAPPGKVATHVHEIGDCSAPDAASAGGHFNPTQKPHGLPPSADRHLGDLGNIDVKPDGTGTTDIVVMDATLNDGAPNSYLGRSIIVHAKLDDGGQPVGNADGRIGCGVIRRSR
jgi:Cu-Zn family superoxide dismutase